jgi:Protein of unknown function (DUF3995)
VTRVVRLKSHPDRDLGWMESGRRAPTIHPMIRVDNKTRPAAWHAFAWTALFIVWHGYWALGGDFGYGDQEAAIPDTTSTLAGWTFTIAVVGMFVAGLAVPLAIVRGAGRRRLLAWLMWAGAAVLVVRGLAGLVDDALRFTGLAETGLSGLTDEQVLGTAHPSAYTIWSTIGLDSFFAAGGLLFARAARLARTAPSGAALVHPEDVHQADQPVVDAVPGPGGRLDRDPEPARTVAVGRAVVDRDDTAAAAAQERQHPHEGVGLTGGLDREVTHSAR